MIVEYMLEQVGRGDAKRAPSWIRDGGHHFNPADYTYLGWVPNLAEREYYVPDSVTTIDRAAAISRALTMHGNSPMQKEDPDNEGSFISMTNDEVSTSIGSWWDAIVVEHANKPASATIEADTDNNSISVTVRWARKGVVVSGTPQLAVDVDGSSITLNKTGTNFNGITFDGAATLSGGETITVAQSSSINLNGGTVTDGVDALELSLATLAEDVTATA